MISLFTGRGIDEESLGLKNLIMLKKQPHFLSFFSLFLFCLLLKKYPLPTNPLNQDSMWMSDPIMTFKNATDQRPPKTYL